MKSDNFVKCLFLNMVLTLLSYLIPKNKYQIILGCRDSTKFSGNPKWFFLYLLRKKNTKFNIFWITSSNHIFTKLKEEKFPVVFLYSFEGFKSILRSNFLIFDDSTKGISYFSFLLGKFNKIQTWHGGGTIKKLKNSTKLHFTLIKRIATFLEIKERRSWVAIVACSEKWRKAYSYFFDYEKVKILGYPRNDVFYQKSFVDRDYNLEFNLKNFNKVILYCPTFREDFKEQIPFSNTFLEKLNNYLQHNNFILLDKRHELEKIKNEKLNFSHIKNISNKVDDIQEILIHTDILITDYSSVFSDFCLTEKPIIYYIYDYDNYLSDRGFVVNDFNELPGIIVKDEDELLNNLKNINKICSNSIYQQNFKNSCSKEHLYKDGKSSERLEKFLLDLINDE